MTSASSLAGRSRPRLQSALPIIAAMVTVLFWASAFVAIRHVGTEISAGALTLGRLAVASLLLGALLFTRAPRWPSRRDWPALLICGVLWFGLYNVALNEAEQRIDAGTAAMVIGIGTLMISQLAGLLLGEGFPRPLVIGSTVAFAGVLVIGAATSTGSTEGIGVLLCVVAAVAWAFAIVAQKPLLSRLPALEVTWLACTIGLVCCLPFGPALVRETADASPPTVFWLVYLGVFPTAVAFTTWAYALTHTSAGKLGVTTYLVPPLTIAMGWLLLGETPALLAIAGGALCLFGVYLARRVSRRAASSKSAGSQAASSQAASSQAASTRAAEPS